MEMFLLSGSIAHVKWFQEPEEKISPSVSAGEFFLITLFVLAVLGLAYFLQRRFLKSFEELISRLAAPYVKYVPLIVRVSAGAGLLAATFGGYFLAPNLGHGPDWMLTAQGLVATLMIVGIGVRTASLILLLLFFAGTFVYGPLEILEHLEYAGVAGYLMIMGPGAFALKRLFLRENLPDPVLRQRALRIFMVAVGLSLTWLAFSEIILSIDLAQSFLSEHHWNFLSVFGVGDRAFILFIGAFELLLGLLLVFNIIPRIASALILGAVVLTAIILGPLEIPGHFYAIGLAAAIWANDGKYAHF